MSAYNKLKSPFCYPDHNENGQEVNVLSVNSITPVTCFHEDMSMGIVIKGVQVACLLDTGCALSVINSKLLEKLGLYGKPLLKCKVRIFKTANGQTFTAKGVICLPINIKGRQFRVLFHVLDNLSHPVILGADFCRKHQVRIDFATSKVECNIPYELSPIQDATILAGQVKTIEMETDLHENIVLPDNLCGIVSTGIMIMIKG